MWRKILGSDVNRWWMGWRSEPGPLKDYYRRDFPTLNTPYDRMEFLAIDLETTGLDPETDEILSIGFVPIVNGRIKLADAVHLLVRPDRPVPEKTAVIHGLLDGTLAAAPPLAEIMPLVLRALTGRVPVAHHARIERLFLSVACRRLYGRPLEVPFVCTLALERRALARRAQEIRDGGLRLGQTRARYGLPRYRAHNALTDALAAGELFLAQAAHASGRQSVQLASLLT